MDIAVTVSFELLRNLLQYVIRTGIAQGTLKFLHFTQDNCLSKGTERPKEVFDETIKALQ